ncbi:hypothetical protein JTB14_023306 [Gonioctena quinquepunctata]|nr:hypothetical protein JTB14_023306 [Gonioctena quinquepunctata]
MPDSINSLRIQRTHSWGYIQENGRFDGLVSLLERREVDFGSSPLLYKLDRMPFVGYGYGNWILRSTFIYRRPKTNAKSYEIFLRPLEKQVWITILMILGVILIALRLAFSHESHVFHKGRLGVESSWSFLVLFTLGAFCQQGATCCPRLFSCRILCVFVFLFCILIYQFYSASIVSYLLMDPPRTIFNLKDLQESHLRVGIEDILIDRNYFVQTTDPDAINLYKKKIKGQDEFIWFLLSIRGPRVGEKGQFRISRGNQHCLPDNRRYIFEPRNMRMDEIQMYRTAHAYQFAEGFSFREMMNFCMLKLVENGNMDRLRKYWDARKPMCIESARKQEIHVGLGEFSCSPVALTLGIWISMTFLIIEFAVYFKKSRRGLNKVYPYVE